jgi:glycosyltransferase involved in cell wall biosynthesis
MKISIITVCFNSIKTIDKTIDSVSKQTYKNIEYIIIDGNSTDGTVEVIKNKEALISKWISEPDSGLYDAMNKGIALSTGELVGVLNSDDVFHSNTVLQQIVEFHSKNEIMASIGNIIQKEVNGKEIRFFSSHKWNPSKLKIGLMPPHPSIFFRRDLFDNLGYYNINFKIGADYELIIRYFLKNKINWKYSGITTTSMLIGGLSSSGCSSYITISREIQKALKMNEVEFSPIIINLRAFLKLVEFIKI